MIRSFGDGLYQITVPLPGNPLRETNAYLLHDAASGRHLLIDNGFNTDEGRLSLLHDLEQLHIDLLRVDAFITHMHADHNGLTSAVCLSPQASVFMGAEEGQRMNASLRPAYWDAAAAVMARHGFSGDELRCIRANHPAVKFASPVPLAFQGVVEGCELRYAGFRLQVICVPGHTPQHLALYEPDRKILFAGDHVLGNITPNIQHWPDFPDSLGAFLKSLDVVAALDIRLTLPGHRTPVTDTKKRVAELKAHHEERLVETLGVLHALKHPVQAYEMASCLVWSTRGTAWDAFPPQQKWFAAGETLAHLERLEVLGKAHRLERDGRIFFTL